MTSRSRYDRGPGFGTVLLVILIVGLIGTAISSFFIWLFWNVCNMHDLYGIAVDASFWQVVISAVVLGSIGGGSSGRSA